MTTVKKSTHTLCETCHKVNGIKEELVTVVYTRYKNGVLVPDEPTISAPTSLSTAHVCTCKLSKVEPLDNE